LRSLAVELAPYDIRVKLRPPEHRRDADDPQRSLTAALHRGPRRHTREEAAAVMTQMNALPAVPWLQPIDVSNAVLYLASDESRYVTGTTTVIDAGASAPRQRCVDAPLGRCSPPRGTPLHFFAARVGKWRAALTRFAGTPRSTTRGGGWGLHEVEQRIRWVWGPFCAARARASDECRLSAPTPPLSGQGASGKEGSPPGRETRNRRPWRRSRR